MATLQTYDIRPSMNFQALPTQEEWFALSPMDLFNTQNYSTHALFFKLDDADKPHIVDVFRRGLENTLGQCRHMAGTVQKREDGTYGILKTPESRVRLDVRRLDDVSAIHPSYADIQKANFSASSLGDPADWTIEGMTMSCRRFPDKSPPMSAFQLNIIRGGLVFTVHKHHAALDIAGTTSLVRQIAKNCASIYHGLEPPRWDEGLMDRSRFTADKSPAAMVDPPLAPGRHPDWHPCSWLLFHLPRSKAAKLKDLCSPQDGTWISTHDAIAAYLWRVLLRRRAEIYKPDLTAPALYCEAINMRSRHFAEAPSVGDVISNAPLSWLAGFIRRVTTSATQEKLEKTLEMLAPVRDKWLMLPQLNALPPTSLVVTDWRGARMCDTDFGFGRPAAFRQLSDTVLENMVVIYPPAPGLQDSFPDQGLELMVPFERHAINDLIRDPDMLRYFEFRGIEACPP
ncbi:transferase family-domain-containing protein [Ustulina deusta]|nr:transferase family-domain-containing protein [Ustulina deusta]